MSSIVIATSRAYLICDKILYMNIEPFLERDEYAARRSANLAQTYMITICFRSADNPSNGNLARNSDEQYIMNLKVLGEEPAMALFKDMVCQIREQSPDQVYLDKMVEQILSGQKGDIHDDTSSTKVRSTRKKKRRS